MVQMEHFDGPNTKIVVRDSNSNLINQIKLGKSFFFTQLNRTVFQFIFTKKSRFSQRFRRYWGYFKIFFVDFFSTLLQIFHQISNNFITNDMVFNIIRFFSIQPFNEQCWLFYSAWAIYISAKDMSIFHFQLPCGRTSSGLKWISNTLKFFFWSDHVHEWRSATIYVQT